jgi:chemotaxis signal transduction protein
LRQFEEQIAQNIQEDQRIIVVDAEGFVLGLVVDHVHEVLNVPKNLMEPPPRPLDHVAGRCQPDEGPEVA